MGRTSSFSSMCLRTVRSLTHWFQGTQFVPHNVSTPSLHCVQFISPTSAPHGIRSALISLPCFRLFWSLPMPKSTHVKWTIFIDCDEFMLRFSKELRQRKLPAVPAIRDNAPKTPYDFYGRSLFTGSIKGIIGFLYGTSDTIPFFLA